ncbi:MAG TPA: glycosyltransferase [Thermoanaerobaculia bacterium]|nr:glycosyltransferase [Thermoanaerobaculia bacterium]
MKPALYGVLPRPPHPSRDGLAIRNYHLLEALAARFEVRAFSLLDPERAYGGGEVPPGVAVEWIPQRTRRLRRAGALARSLATGRAYSELLYASGELARRVAAACAARRPAWVVAHAYHVAPLALASGARVWIDFHNLDSQIWERVAATGSSAPRRAFAGLQAPRVRRLEGSLVRAAAGSSCVSRGDAEALAALGPAAPPLVVPNGVDLGRYTLRGAPPRAETIVFVGDLSWPPNAEGVAWFAKSVWPRVRAARPDATVEVVGRDAPSALTALGGERFVFAGEGGDTRPVWARAAVAIVPLLAGGGTRLKVLEAAACGAPVVATAVGAEGLDLSDAEIRRADRPEDFAAAVVGLLADPEAARRQAAAARARVEAAYGWAAIGRAFAAELSRRAEERA